MSAPVASPPIAMCEGCGGFPVVVSAPAERGGRKVWLYLCSACACGDSVVPYERTVEDELEERPEALRREQENG